MKRLKVYLESTHCLYTVLKNYLMPTGVVLVSTPSQADVQIVSEVTSSRIPTVLLGSSDVYVGSKWLQRPHVRPQTGLSEDLDVSILPTRDPQSYQLFRSLLRESAAFQKSTRVLVLRLFEVYGEDVHEGLVYYMLGLAKNKKAITLPLPGYQEVSVLYQEDFIKFFSKLWPKFLEGLGGIYNIGSSTEISLHRLADTVWQLSNNTKDTAAISLERFPVSVPWKFLPDMTRSYAEFGVCDTTSPRSGIWHTVQRDPSTQ